MGLILEQDVIDEDTSEMGVIQVVKIDPNGNTAKSNQDICIGDWILEVNGNHCFHHLENDHETNNKDEPNTHPNMTLEQVIDIIIQSPSIEISLTLGRPEQSVILKFANGINIATTPGAYLKQLASTALVPIPYSCDSGGCGTCEQIMRIPRKDNDKDGGNDNCGDLWDERYVRPCVARVPKGSNTILISPSDRLEVD